MTDEARRLIIALMTHVRDNGEFAGRSELLAWGDDVLSRPGVTVDVEALAAILWREQAVDVGAPLSVSAGRTHEEFAGQAPETRAPFLKYAKAALRALTGEPS